MILFLSKLTWRKSGVAWSKFRAVNKWTLLALVTIPANHDRKKGETYFRFRKQAHCKILALREMMFHVVLCVHAYARYAKINDKIKIDLLFLNYYLKMRTELWNYFLVFLGLSYPNKEKRMLWEKESWNRVN